MTQELICITCPIGCHLVVERGSGDELAVGGNRCPRGAAYAREELLTPKRTVTATCRARTSHGSCVDRGLSATLEPGRCATAAKRIPCRTSAPFPRERVDELLAVIYALEEPLPIKAGRILIHDVFGLGIDVVATRTLD